VHSLRLGQLVTHDNGIIWRCVGAFTGFYTHSLPFSYSICHSRCRVTPCPFQLPWDSHRKMGKENSHSQCRPLIILWAHTSYLKSHHFVSKIWNKIPETPLPFIHPVFHGSSPTAPWSGDRPSSSLLCLLPKSAGNAPAVLRCFKDKISDMSWLTQVNIWMLKNAEIANSYFSKQLLTHCYITAWQTMFLNRAIRRHYWPLVLRSPDLSCC